MPLVTGMDCMCSEVGLAVIPCAKTIAFPGNSQSPEIFGINIYRLAVFVDKAAML